MRCNDAYRYRQTGLIVLGLDTFNKYYVLIQSFSFKISFGTGTIFGREWSGKLHIYAC